MSKRKDFDPALHEQYDDLGREYVRQWAEQRGLTAVDYEDEYDLDLEIWNDDEFVMFAEAEVRPGPMRYTTLHVPERKRKFFESGAHYFQAWPDEGMLYHMWPDQILDSPLREVSNKYVDEDEFFFDVPITMTTATPIRNNLPGQAL